MCGTARAPQQHHRRRRVCPQASAAHSRHFQGQKLRLGGDALGADPTYLLYLPSGSRGELRRIDFGAWPRAATLPPTIFPRTSPQASAAHSWHLPGQKLRLGGDALGADPTYLLYLAHMLRGELRRMDFAAWPHAATFRLRLAPGSAASLCCTPAAFLDRSSCWPLPACKMQQVAGALIPHLPENFSPFGGPSHGE